MQFRKVQIANLLINKLVLKHGCDQDEDWDDRLWQCVQTLQSSPVGRRSHSRPEAEAVRGVVDHDLAEGWHNHQDEDGHDLHEESQASLPTQGAGVKHDTHTTLYILGFKNLQR